MLIAEKRNVLLKSKSARLQALCMQSSIITILKVKRDFARFQWLCRLERKGYQGSTVYVVSVPTTFDPVYVDK